MHHVVTDALELPKHCIVALWVPDSEGQVRPREHVDETVEGARAVNHRLHH